MRFLRIVNTKAFGACCSIAVCYNKTDINLKGSVCNQTPTGIFNCSISCGEIQARENQAVLGFLNYTSNKNVKKIINFFLNHSV